MIKKTNILILMTVALGLSIPGRSGICQTTCTPSATTPICITSQNTTYAAGTTSITFTATTSAGVSEASFYYGTTPPTPPATSPAPSTITTYMGTATDGTCSGSTCSFVYTWNNVPSGGTIYVDAVIGSGSSAGGGTTNGVIDKVLGLDDNGQPITFTYPGLGIPEVNPASDTNFGPASFSCLADDSTDTWSGGDNQMCLTTYPYNGSSSADLFGTCEWTGGSGSGSLSLKNGGSGSATMTFCSLNPATPTLTTASTVDSLDETMHILSHFDLFAQNIFGKDLGTINSTFDNWYPQAAGWIAPACSSSGCTAASFSNASSQTCTPGVANPCNPYCLSSASIPGSDTAPGSDTTCNQGGPGRLLSIYDPMGYPGLTNVTSNNKTPVDELKTWNTLITSWLNTSYTPADSTSSNLWCVPTESTESGLQVLKNDVTIPTAEDTYIRVNAPTPIWGDLSHVIACLNYNASSTPAGTVPNASNDQACLSALMSYAPGACPSAVPYQCASVSPPASLSTNDCDPYYVDQTTGIQSYAGWVNSQINFGAGNSYKACLSALTSSSTCPTTLPEACNPWILGRTLLGNTEPKPSSFPEYEDNGSPCSTPSATCKNISCDISTTGSFAKWVNDSLTMFTDEQPKFALRSAFLTDIYTRAQTMQNIFTQGDTALHNFFKPCIGYCADGNACPSSGICDDGSLCVAIGGAPSCDSGKGTCTDKGKCSDGTGSCNYCAYGGPAAQLIYAKSLANPVRQLPNSVIYGWVDQTLPNGHLLPGTSAGQPGGYAHIVKVTAYSPGRDGPSTEGPPAEVQSVLPWINSWNTFLYQYYTLTNRDGDVYVSVQRWDQDHANATTFPNGHALWQFLFHNPTNPPVASTGNSLLQECTSTYNSLLPESSPLGFGLENLTVQGLISSSVSISTHANDQTALQNAFMLNDSGDGTVDPNALSGTSSSTSCVNGNSSPYCTCLKTVIQLLDSGVESHACARYTAALNGDDPSNTQDSDYSLKFIDCNSIEKGQVPSSSP